MNKDIYVFPTLRKFDNFESLMKTEIDDPIFSFLEDKVEMENLYDSKYCFVLGEPGYGKSRLLKEVVLRSVNHNKKAFYIDLKKLKGNFHNEINSYIEEATEIKETEIGDIDELRLLKTPSFKLTNSVSTVICFDGLDEVTQGEEFSNIVDNIKIFTNKFNKCTIFVSCRTHQYQKYHNLFDDTKISYIRVEPFSHKQVFDYLNNYGISDDDKDRLLHNISFQNRNLVIQVPRYLMMLGKLFKQKDIDYVIDLNISQLFEKFIYMKLKEEGKKEYISGVSKTELIMRVLEKLALIMEIYQTNIISKDELITFFDDVKSNLNINFLQQVSLDELYERTVLKDYIDSIEFENTEFQEYLAAKEIIRIGKQDQVIFDLSVEPQTREIYPSWFNTIRFLLYLDIGLLRPILEFGDYDNKNLKDPEYHKLLSTTNLENLDLKDKFDIFKNIFLYYQNISHYIDINLAKNLSLYYNKKHLNVIKDSIDQRKYSGENLFIRESNSSRILYFLIERNLLTKDQISYWKEKYLKIIKRDTKNEVLVRSSIAILGKLKDINILKEIYHEIDLDQQHIQDEFIHACIGCNSDDKFSIELYIKATKWKNINSRHGLYEIKKLDNILIYLDRLINDDIFLTNFLYYEDIFKETDHILIDNIDSIYNKRIEDKLKELIIYSITNKYYYKCEKSEFIKGISKLVYKNDNNFIFEVLQKLKSIKDNYSFFLHSQEMFSILLQKSQIKQFIESVRKIERGADFAYNVLFKIKYSGGENSDIIYEEGRKYLPEVYTQYDEISKKQKRKQIEDEEKRIISLYKTFQLLLEPEPKKYSDSVFGYYLQHKDDLNGIIKQKDKDRLIHLVRNVVLNKINPLEQNLKIDSFSDGATQYTTTNLIIMFRDCLEILQEFKIDVHEDRQKVLSFIPFAYEEQLQIIFNIVPNPSSDEINKLLSVYDGSRGDDLPIHQPLSFIKSCKKYNIKESVVVLKLLVDNERLRDYERITAFETINSLVPDEKYNIKIFNEYLGVKGTELFQLAEKANEYLSSHFSNEDAIQWRFKEIKNRVIPFKIPWGKTYSPTTMESELSDKEFAKPLMDLKNPKYKRNFYDLLDYSFKVYKKGEDFYQYCEYIWEIIVSYFANLREKKSIGVLVELEEYLNKKSRVFGINWFRLKLIKLKRHYLLYIGKPINISDCIKQYNELKERQYLEISTPFDLYNLVDEVIETDLKKFVESEGFYKTVELVKGSQEDLIQKTIKTQFEISFLRRGFREYEVNIQREEHLLDDKRSDFLISYGFVSPILIEIKRLDNNEITNDNKRLNYRKKLLQYIEGFNCQYGVFFILRIKEHPTIDNMKKKLNKVYENDKNISVKYLDCLKKMN